MATSEKIPKRAGVVLKIARSDHCRSRLNAKVGPYFMKSDLDLPTQDKPSHNLCGFNVVIGTEQGLWIELAFWITNEDPTNGNRCHTRMIPKSGCCISFKSTLLPRSCSG